MQQKTLFHKVWDSHVVVAPEGEPALLYVDLHLVHEVTSPQAFEGLRLAARTVRRPDRVVATVDHNVPHDCQPADRGRRHRGQTNGLPPCAPTAPSLASLSSTLSPPSKASSM